MGLLDAAQLAEVLLLAWQHQLPVDQPKLLRRYERHRKGANLAMMGLMEGFKRLFASRIMDKAA